jgi:hypothetical protein
MNPQQRDALRGSARWDDSPCPRSDFRRSLWGRPLEDSPETQYRSNSQVSTCPRGNVAPWASNLRGERIALMVCRPSGIPPGLGGGGSGGLRELRLAGKHCERSS